MSKVFTITPGLENMGALRTGGQGSVYKGRRTGEIITAIKLLPTPIYSETAAYGHMGRKNEVVEKIFTNPYGKAVTKTVELFTWEKLDAVKDVKKVFGLK